jgi:hypothetical protein
MTQGLSGSAIRARVELEFTASVDTKSALPARHERCRGRAAGAAEVIGIQILVPRVRLDCDHRHGPMASPTQWYVLRRFDGIGTILSDGHRRVPCPIRVPGRTELGINLREARMR